ncbi:MAG TPA: ATP-binding protein [Thermoanaerobaculia bacterium]
MTRFRSLWRRLDPRRRLAARLLLALFLTFALPGAVLVVLLERRLGGVEESTAARLAAARIGEETMRLHQDAEMRAQSIDRGARIAEEAAWSLAEAARVLLADPDGARGGVPPADAHGHVWNAEPGAASLGYISLDRSSDRAARRDLAATRALEPLMQGVRRRLPAIRTVSLWTASGVARVSPWVDLHEGIRTSGGALERFQFNRMARFTVSPSPEGDRAVWTAAFAGPTMTPEARYVSLFVPVRDAAGVLRAGIAFDVDPRRYAAQAVDRGGLPGDLWFALDGLGHAIVMPAKAGELLRWRGDETERLEDSEEPERRRLARAVLADERAVDTYRFRGREHRFASARSPATGWVFVEGLSADRLARLAAGPDDAASDLRIGPLRRDTALLFGLLLLLVFGAVLWAARRISAPVRRLVGAAEAMGRGQEVEVDGQAGRDELGRLATAIDRMGRRVERRVETLHRLHGLLRAAHPTADLQEVQSRASAAIAAFTDAERVWFFFHDPDTNRLDAAWPGWNLPEELAQKLRIPSDKPSIAWMVFRTGEIHVSNDLSRDPYSNRELQTLEAAENAIFAPLKTEGKMIGVVAATNRRGGFGPEEADAMVIFADAASLLIQNARLYGTLTGTVSELERASRLKDHFLQNVNHELRTPLTSIVGWTDLFDDGAAATDAETLRRGLRQIRQSSRLLLALIDDLLDLARLDRGALKLEWRSVSIGDVVTRSIETMRLMAEGRGVTLLAAPLPEDLLPVRADPLRLQQVLWNLLVNAIKFTPRFGRVIVRVEREPERYLVSVEDDGAGIPEAELPHVFERFRQVDGSATRRHPGMGIGLSLARSLVELHGGTIWAESTVGRGSRFTFSLPIRAWRGTAETEIVEIGEAAREA